LSTVERAESYCLKQLVVVCYAIVATVKSLAFSVELLDGLSKVPNLFESGCNGTPVVLSVSLLKDRRKKDLKHASITCMSLPDTVIHSKFFLPIRWTMFCVLLDLASISVIAPPILRDAVFPT
jgi:hypothetical protein